MKSGKGTSCSMNSYRRAFGIVWNEETESSYPEYSQSALSFGKASMTRRTSSLGSIGSVPGRHGEESRKVQLVRSRCQLQNEALSTWWRFALQAHLQQRMWMQLGRNQVETNLPPRFERVYQPENLGQFDRYFSRAWSTPVRRSHAAQHTDGVEDGAAPGDLVRVITGHVQDSNPLETTEDSGKVTVRDFVDKYGFDLWSENSLRRFSEYHSKLTRVPDAAYSGSLEKNTASTRDEYVRYLNPSNDRSEHPQEYRPERVEEFKECLSDCMLDANDVSGIRKVRKRFLRFVRIFLSSGMANKDETAC